MIMELVRSSWDRDDYDKFIKYLFEIRDSKYAKFYGNLGIGNSIIGIRTPILKKISKDIYEGNYREFLDVLKEDYYEEITLYGFIICHIKDLEESISYLEKYKKRINNWASCDLFCSGYKIVLKNKEYFLGYIIDNISSDNLWVRRLCFVLLLSYYIDENYLERIFYLCDNYNTSFYYVQMAVAWLISICYIKFPSATLNYLSNNKLDDFTHNKAISKIKDSYRVGKSDKDYLSNLKRK